MRTETFFFLSIPSTTLSTLLSAIHLVMEEESELSQVTQQDMAREGGEALVSLAPSVSEAFLCDSLT